MRRWRQVDERDAVTAATAAEVLRSPRKLLSIRRSLRDETWPVVAVVSLAGLVVLGIALTHGVAPLAGPAVAPLVARPLRGDGGDDGDPDPALAELAVLRAAARGADRADRRLPALADRSAPAPARARRAEGRVHRGDLARAPDAARVGARQRDH